MAAGLQRAVAAAYATHGKPGAVTVSYPVRTVSEVNRRDHWATKAKRTKDQRNAARWELQRVNVGKLTAPVIVTLTRIAPRALDDDNLRSALKATRDGVADLLEVDDRDPQVTWRYGQEKGVPHYYGVRIEVERRNT